MASVGNQEKVEHYRNDSPAKIVRIGCCGWWESEQLGVCLLKYCRHEEERKKSSKECAAEGCFIEDLRGGR